MPSTSAVSVSAFDTQTSVELAASKYVDRIAFVVVYSLLSAAILPWTVGAIWTTSVLLLELIVRPWFDRLVVRLPSERAAFAFAAFHFASACLYEVMAFRGLSSGSPVGVAMGATWIAGAVLTSFIHYNSNRRLLLATLIPIAATAMVGPYFAFGNSWASLLTPVFVGLAMLSARRFSVDHGALLEKLADRQAAFLGVERKLAITIEASGDGLFETDLLSDEIHFSPSWLKMLGYDDGEVTSPTAGWRAFVHPDDLPDLEREYVRHFRGETDHTVSELRMRCKSGQYKWVYSRAKLVERTSGGAPARVVGTTIDISERKALETQLQSAREEAERANHAKTAFIANMSHEIRTPLNGVLGMAQAMALDDLKDVQRERLDIVRASGESLLMILNDMLDLSKIEAGKLELEVIEFDLEQLALGAHATFSAIAAEKGLSFNVDADAARGLYRGDPTRIRQVLYNLISNAIKFTEAGEVGVTLWFDGAELVTTITDSGIGMSVASMANLFAKFVQADSSTTRRFGGTGLGLAICRELAELMGGSVTASSKEGRGSTFEFRIPITRTGDVGSTAVSSTPVASEAPTADIRVLAAEDNKVNQLVLKTLLEQVGVTPMLVDNGKLAVEAWEESDWDVILMDVQMPVMDGIEATRIIREREELIQRSRTPIIALTANAMSHQLAEYLACGMDGHVAKPIEVAKLFQALEAAIDQRQQSAARSAA